MAAEFEELLYRAAIGAQLDQPDNSPQVREVARLLARLVPMLSRRPPVGRWRVEIAFDGAKVPGITPMKPVYGELD